MNAFAQLEAEVAKTSDITNEFSEQMTEEFEIFQKSKATELKQGMLAYADSHIDFYTKVWRMNGTHIGKWSI